VIKSRKGFGYIFALKLSKFSNEKTEVVASKPFKNPLDKEFSSEEALLFRINSPTENVMDELSGAFNVATLPIT